MSEQHPELCTSCTDSSGKLSATKIEEKFNSPSALRAIRAERAAEGSEQGYRPAPVSADQVVPDLDFVRRPEIQRSFPVIAPETRFNQNNPTLGGALRTSDQYSHKPHQGQPALRANTGGRPFRVVSDLLPRTPIAQHFTVSGVPTSANLLNAQIEFQQPPAKKATSTTEDLEDDSEDDWQPVGSDGGDSISRRKGKKTNETKAGGKGIKSNPAGVGSKRRFAENADKDKHSLWDEEGRWTGRQAPAAEGEAPPPPLPEPSVIKDVRDGVPWVEGGCGSWRLWQVAVEGSFDYSPAFKGSSRDEAISNAWSELSRPEFRALVIAQIFGADGELDKKIKAYHRCPKDCPKVKWETISKSYQVSAMIVESEATYLYRNKKTGDTVRRTPSGHSHATAAADDADDWETVGDSRDDKSAKIRIKYWVRVYLKVRCEKEVKENQQGG
ncbi:MAG: hypothetical protein KDB07_06920 [Planctomycetes bacterium]|nr:hypothetical protein [Planctomycetota bacterium]